MSGNVPSAPASTGAFQPLNSVWNHKLLAIAVALLVMTVGTAVAYVMGTAVYRATAVVYVAPRFANILSGSSELEFQSSTQYYQFVNQQLRTINRYDIMLEALRRLGDRRFVLWQQEGETDRKAAERLQSSLEIKDVRDTYLITVSLESEQPKGLQDLVNSVVTVYLEQVKTDELYASDQRIEILRENRAERVARIAELVERRSELAQKLGVTTFADSAINPYDNLLIEVKSVVFDAERARINAEAELATYDATISGEVAAQALEAAAGEAASSDAGLNSLKANLYKRRSELLEQTTGLGPEHPVRRKAERELRDLEAEVQRATAELIAEKAALILDQRRARVRETSAVESVLRKQLKAQQDDAAWYSTHYNEALDVTDAIDRERRALDSIDDRVEFLTLESNAPGLVRLANAALEPLEPVSGGRTKLAVLFAIVGVVAGLGAAIAVDLVDRRVRTTGQVRAILGFPPLASFLEPSTDPARQALMADQMRRLAMVLGREHSANQMRRVMVTSARHGSGATTVVLDLGRELARQGLRVLVVEANLLIPDPRYQGDQARPALVDVLNNDSDPFAAISPATDELPDRIATGVLPNEHLSDCARLGAVIQQLSGGYDLMLIDAAPIRLSADTEYLVGVCDASWLVVRAMHARLGEVKGSAARLEKAAPPAIGLIMTGLPVFLGGGYYAELLKEYRKVEKERALQTATQPAQEAEASAESALASDDSPNEASGEASDQKINEAQQAQAKPKAKAKSSPTDEATARAQPEPDETAWALEQPPRRWRRPGGAGHS